MTSEYDSVCKNHGYGNWEETDLTMYARWKHSVLRWFLGENMPVPRRPLPSQHQSLSQFLIPLHRSPFLPVFAFCNRGSCRRLQTTAPVRPRTLHFALRFPRAQRRVANSHGPPFFTQIIDPWSAAEPVYDVRVVIGLAADSRIRTHFTPLSKEQIRPDTLLG